MRKQIHWKTIRNSVSKLNNSQLICNKTAVTILNALTDIHAHAGIEHLSNIVQPLETDQNKKKQQQTKELAITKMKTYTKLTRNYRNVMQCASKQIVVCGIGRLASGKMIGS